EWTPWLHITMELLGDAVTYAGAVLYGSALFATNRKITIDEIPVRLEDIPDECKLELFERSAQRFEGEDRGIVECARAYLLFLLGQSQEAIEHIDRIESEYRSPRMEFAVAGMREGFRALANR